jgi:hypothetical protein
MSSIPPGLWTASGAGSMLALLYFLLATGRLVPRSTVDMLMSERDETIRVQRSTIEKLTSATQDLAVGNYTAAHALHTVAKPGKGGDES